MAAKDEAVKTSVETVADFLKNPAELYAKVKAGERLVLTGNDGKEQMVLYPGSIADYDQD